MIGQRPDGPELERWRKSLGLSREALGAAAGGIASATVKRVERGEVKPQPSTLSALVGALSARSAFPSNANDGAGPPPPLATSTGLDPRHVAE